MVDGGEVRTGRSLLVVGVVASFALCSLAIYRSAQSTAGGYLGWTHGGDDFDGDDDRASEGDWSGGEDGGGGGD